MTEKDNITEYIARRIRYYRKQRNLTQKELGQLINLEHNTISSYEMGTNRVAQEVLFSIARALDVEIDDFYPPTKEYSSVLKEESGMYGIGDVLMIPIVGNISCGDGVIAYEDIEGYEPIPKDWLNGGSEHFCLRAKGDSMIGARIHHGDLLLIREQPEVESGEIAAVLIEGDAVLKRVYKNNGQLVLQSENPMYQPIVSPPAEVKIIGKLRKIIINM